jgi:hypothetical protein
MGCISPRIHFLVEIVMPFPMEIFRIGGNYHCPIRKTTGKTEGIICASIANILNIVCNNKIIISYLPAWSIICISREGANCISHQCRWCQVQSFWQWTIVCYVCCQNTRVSSVSAKKLMSKNLKNDIR